MPISKENKSRYPANWKEIVARIKERAGNKCEFCGVPNYEYIFRGIWNDGKKEYEVFQTVNGNIYGAGDGKLLSEADFTAFIMPLSNKPKQKAVKVVLTVAHLDHTPENCEDDNLKALCQKHHLEYDKLHHLMNSAETRKKKKKQFELFDNGK